MSGLSVTRLGLSVTTPRKGDITPPWYKEDAWKADGVLPSMISDFGEDRYASGGNESTFANLFTFSRASTATYVDVDGIVKTAASDVKRFCYLLGEKALLLEKSGTNLCTRSQDYANWAAAVGGAYSAGAADIIDSVNSCLFTEDTSSSSHEIKSPSVTISSTGTYTASVFVKAGTATSCQLTFGNGAITSNCFANFVLTGSGSVGNSSNVDQASIYKIAEGVYKIAISRSFSGTGSTSIRICTLSDPATDGRGPSFVGSGRTLEANGFQLESGSLLTSYIPTTVSTVSRANEYCLSDATDYITAPATGTAYASYAALGSSTYKAVVGCRPDGPQFGRFASVVWGDFPVGGSNQGNLNAPLNTYAYGVSFNVAWAWQLNNAQAAKDGQAGVVDTTFAQPTDISTTALGSRNSNGGVDDCWYVKQVRFYPNRASQSALEAMTA